MKSKIPSTNYPAALRHRPITVLNHSARANRAASILKSRAASQLRESIGKYSPRTTRAIKALHREFALIILYKYAESALTDFDEVYNASEANRAT